MNGTPRTAKNYFLAAAFILFGTYFFISWYQGITTKNPQVSTTSTTTVATSTPAAAASSTATYTVKIAEEFMSRGVTFFVEYLIGDSRCPADVTCIHAGDASISVRATMETATTSTMREGDTWRVYDHALTLDSVTPYPVSTSSYKHGDYRFIFTLTPQ